MFLISILNQTRKTPEHVTPAFLAPMRRFERPTCRLGGGCSILLSYVGICGIFYPPAAAPPLCGTNCRYAHRLAKRQ